MKRRGRNEQFEKKDLSKLNSAVFSLLEKKGIRILHDGLLNILQQRGFQINKDEKIVKFRSEEIEDIIQKQKNSGPIKEEQNNYYSTQLTALVAPFYYDYDKKIKRYATKEDLITMIKFSDARGDKVSLPLTVQDFDPGIEPIESLSLLIKYAHKPAVAYDHYAKSTAHITTFAMDADQVKYLARINEVLYGKAIPPRGPDFMTSPLTLGSQFAEYLLELKNYTVPFHCVGSQSISGVSAPLSIAGGIVTSACEILGGWIIINALDSYANLVGAVCNGILDPRIGIVSFNAPEAILQNIGVVELFDKLYGGHVYNAAGNDYIDAKVPGFKAIYERVYRAFAHASFTGRDFYLGGSGALDGGNIFSPLQFLMEEDIGDGLWKFTQGIQVDDESLDLESINNIPFSDLSYMETNHSLMNCRTVFWLPNLLERNLWVDLETELGEENRLLERANERFKDTVKKYELPEHDPNLIKEIDQIVKEARAKLLNE